MEDEDTFLVFVFNQEVKKVLQPVKYWQFAAKQCAEKQGAQTFCNVPFKQCGSGACVFQLPPKLLNRLSNKHVEKLVGVRKS